MVFISINSLVSIIKIKATLITVLVATSLIHIQASLDETDILQQLGLVIEYQPQEKLNVHAETIFKTIINVLGHNINLKARNTESKATEKDSTYNKTDDFLALLKKCLLKKLNPNTVYADRTGMTPLHHAALLGLPDVVKLLLVHKADYQAKDSEGRVALWYADPATHSEELKYQEPKYSLLIPFVGTAMAYSAYKYWLNHQLCYELLMKAENKNWEPAIDLNELGYIKKHVYSDEKNCLSSLPKG